jgi:outer membrane protein OmpA-like peptidoglycan-associated protein
MKRKIIQFYLFLLMVVCSHVQTYSQNQNIEEQREPLSLKVYIDKVGVYEFPTIYDDHVKEIYFSVDELFTTLKFTYVKENNGQLVKGYINDANNAFVVDISNKTITCKNRALPLESKDLIVDRGALLLSQNILDKALGLHIKFDFREMRARLSADYELPMVRYKMQEDARKRLSGRATDEIKYDAVFSRQYHLFRPGMLDWSFSANQTDFAAKNTRFGLGLGAEVLGGETDVWLNYSNTSHFNRNEQRYQWLWVDNNFNPMRQVQVGRVYSSSIASLLYPVDGVMITNTPTTNRKLKGTYTIADHTEPNWLVELYINQSLTAYVKADASGFYTFQVPLVYGKTDITLKFYSPNGEEHAAEKRINIPYSFLPQGEFEYRVTGGILLDTLHSHYGRAEISYGLSRYITAGAGVEYLQSIQTNSPYIPFATLYIQPFTSLFLTGQYAHKVFSKATLNVNMGTFTLDGSYTQYDPSQTATFFRYRKEITGNATLPYCISKTLGYIRAGYHGYVYDDFSYNSGQVILSNNIGRVNLNLSTFYNWSTGALFNCYSNLSVGYRFPFQMQAILSGEYNYTTQSLNHLKAEIEKRIFRQGYLTVRYEDDLVSKLNSFNVSLRCNLNVLTAGVSSFFNKNALETAESASGSLAFGSGKKYVHANAFNSVTHSGISIMGYVDANFNGVRDADEPSVEGLNIRCSGGQIISRNDSIKRIFGLEPFREYTLTIDETGLSNPAWKINKKSIKITTDPNQFKKIDVAVLPMGEANGVVTDPDKNRMGKLIVHIYSGKDSIVATTYTEDDGYYSYLGLTPGKYKVAIDRQQLKALHMDNDPQPLTIEKSYSGDIKSVNLFLIPPKPEPKDTIAIEITSPIKKLEAKLDSLLRYSVQFVTGKATIAGIYKSALGIIADIFKAYPCLKFEIQGHTDNVGSDQINQVLSEKRAMAVYNELIKLKVGKNQLVPKGYGKTRPLNENKTPEERAMNRRMAFRYIPDKDCVISDSIINVLNHLKSLNKKIKETPDESKESEEIVSAKKLRQILAALQKTNIVFTGQQADLKEENKALLDSLINIVKMNPALKVNITFRSASGDRMPLNQERMQTIRNYLQDNGIEGSKIEIATQWEDTTKIGPTVMNTKNESPITVSVSSSVKSESVKTTSIQRSKKINLDYNNLFIGQYNNHYSIQLGAFFSEAIALNLAGKIKGLFAQKLFVTNEAGYYIVKLGDLKTPDEAEKMKAYILSEEFQEKIRAAE